eukprot:gene386-718_t
MAAHVAMRPLKDPLGGDQGIGRPASIVQLEAGVYSLSRAINLTATSAVGLKLNGAGVSSTTLTTSRTDSAVLSLQGVMNFTLKGLNIRDVASSTSGGAVSIVDFPLGCPTFEDIEFHNTSSSRLGGAISMQLTYCAVNLTNVKFYDCSAGDGGAVYMDAASAEFTSAVFQANQANSAGAVLASSSMVTFVESSFTSNSASTLHGGAVEAIDSDVRLTACTLSANHAKDSGGAVYTMHGDATFTSCAFSSNVADERGGAVSAFRSDVYSVSSTYTGNRAVYGGALDVSEASGASAVVLEGDTLQDNTASVFGGGLLIHHSNEQLDVATISVSGAAFTGNSAHAGGAYALWSITAVNILISTSTFTSNSAFTGGAVYVDKTQTVNAVSHNLTSVVMLSNTARGGGGGAIFFPVVCDADRCSLVSPISVLCSPDSTGNDTMLTTPDATSPTYVPAWDCWDWSANSAQEGGYGHVAASSAFALQAIPSSVTDYASGAMFEPRLRVLAVDVFNQTVTANYSAVVRAQLVAPDASTELLEGGQNEYVGAEVTGEANFTSLSLLATAGQHTVTFAPSSILAPTLHTNLTVTVRDCVLGEYLNVSSSRPSKCMPCGLGQYGTTYLGVSNAANWCETCPAGRFGNSTGALQCHDCPAGFVVAVTGSTQSADCGVCPSNTISSEGMAECFECPTGSVHVRHSQCACQAGTYRVAGAADAFYNTIAQDAGLSTPSTVDFQCMACGVGTFSEGTDATSCTKCQAGTYSAATGASSASTCVACSINYIASTEGMEGCTACPTNSLDNSRISCECTEGFYKSFLGNSMICVACPSGFYNSISGSEACTPCPAGTYSQGTGATSESTCLACAANTYSTANSSECLACPALAADNAHLSCSCQPGYRRVEGSSGLANDFTCIACPQGYYTQSDDAAACVPCEDGTYSDLEAAPSIDNCLACSANSFSVGGAATLCTQCPTSGTSKQRASLCKEPSGGYTAGTDVTLYVLTTDTQDTGSVGFGVTGLMEGAVPVTSGVVTYGTNGEYSFIVNHTVPGKYLVEVARKSTVTKPTVNGVVTYKYEITVISALPDALLSLVLGCNDIGVCRSMEAGADARLLVELHDVYNNLVEEPSRHGATVFVDQNELTFLSEAKKYPFSVSYTKATIHTAECLLTIDNTVSTVISTLEFDVTASTPDVEYSLVTERATGTVCAAGASTCKVQGAVIAGDMVDVAVTARDRFDNAVTVGGTSAAMVLTAQTGDVTYLASTTDWLNGTYSLRHAPSFAAEYSSSVTLGAFIVLEDLQLEVQSGAPVPAQSFVSMDSGATACLANVTCAPAQEAHLSSTVTVALRDGYGNTPSTDYGARVTYVPESGYKYNASETADANTFIVSFQEGVAGSYAVNFWLDDTMLGNSPLRLDVVPSYMVVWSTEVSRLQAETCFRLYVNTVPPTISASMELSFDSSGLSDAEVTNLVTAALVEVLGVSASLITVEAIHGRATSVRRQLHQVTAVNVTYRVSAQTMNDVDTVVSAWSAMEDPEFASSLAATSSFQSQSIAVDNAEVKEGTTSYTIPDASPADSQLFHSSSQGLQCQNEQLCPAEEVSAGVPVTYEIVLYDEYANRMTYNPSGGCIAWIAHLSDESVSEEDAVNNEDGTYTLKLSALNRIGTYSVRVYLNGLSDSAVVNGMTTGTYVSVTWAPTSAAKMSMYEQSGASSTSSRGIIAAGEELELLFTPLDAFANHRRVGGEDVVGSLTNTNLSAVLKEASLSTVFHTETALYRMTGSVSLPGVYDLHVTLSGQPVPGSPSQLAVVPAAVAPEMCRIYHTGERRSQGDLCNVQVGSAAGDAMERLGGGLADPLVASLAEGLTDPSAPVYILSRDRFGNVRDDPLSEDRFLVEVHDAKSTKLLSKLTTPAVREGLVLHRAVAALALEHAGQIRLSVLWPGTSELVHGSPYSTILKCPAGYFPNSLDGYTPGCVKCEDETEGITCHGSEAFTLRDGYWVAPQAAGCATGDCVLQRVYECSPKSACSPDMAGDQGTRTVAAFAQISGIALCGESYRSDVVRCGGCKAGYYQRLDGSCTQCSDTGWKAWLQTLALVSVLLGAVTLLFRVALRHVFNERLEKKRLAKLEQHAALALPMLSHKPEGNAADMGRSLTLRRRQMSAAAKQDVDVVGGGKAFVSSSGMWLIVTDSLQVLGSFTYIFGKRLPFKLQTLYSWVDLINLPGFNFIYGECLVVSMQDDLESVGGFYYEFIWKAVLPVLLCGAIVTFIATNREKNSADLLSSTFLVFIFFINLLHAGVSTTMFSLFVCTPIYFDEECTGDCSDLTAPQWLEADLSVQCFHGKYNYFRAVALLVIVFYVIAFPLVLFLVLRHFTKSYRVFVAKKSDGAYADDDADNCPSPGPFAAWGEPKHFYTFHIETLDPAKGASSGSPPRYFAMMPPMEREPWGAFLWRYLHGLPDREGSLRIEVKPDLIAVAGDRGSHMIINRTRLQTDPSVIVYFAQVMAPFENGFYYWPCLILLRRLLQTAMVVVVKIWFSDMVFIYSLCISFAAIIVEAYMHPFISVYDDRNSIAMLANQYLVLLISMFLYEMEGLPDEFISWALVTLQAVLFSYVVYVNVQRQRGLIDTALEKVTTSMSKKMGQSAQLGMKLKTSVSKSVGFGNDADSAAADTNPTDSNPPDAVTKESGAVDKESAVSTKI